MYSSLQVGLITHIKFQDTTLQQVFMFHIILRIFISIQTEAIQYTYFQNYVCCIMTNERSILQMKCSFLEQRSTENIFIGSRTNRDRNLMLRTHTRQKSVHCLHLHNTHQDREYTYGSSPDATNIELSKAVRHNCTCKSCAV